jgi:phosphate starvation-inducible protein PhoH
MARKTRVNSRRTRIERIEEEARQNVSAIVSYEQPKKKFTLHDLKHISPLTENQEKTFYEWDDGQNLVLDGHAGVGKTFLALYLALQTVLDPKTPQTRIIIAKTPVQSHEIGFLKGDEDMKVAPFEAPYKAILNELFAKKGAYDTMKENGVIEFEPMVAVRGMTFGDAVIIVDEIQNMTEGEAETIITRAGRDTRIIFCGDDCQNDIGKDSGFSRIIPIFRRMNSMSFVNFGIEDCVRGGLAREFLMAKYRKSY